MPTQDAPAPQSDSIVPNCRACEHYYITWDENFPYGCKALHFKSKHLPRLDVKESSGTDCLFFSAKKIPDR